MSPLQRIQHMQAGCWVDQKGNITPIDRIPTTHLRHILKFAPSWFCVYIQDELRHRKGLYKQVLPVLEKCNANL